MKSKSTESKFNNVPRCIHGESMLALNSARFIKGHRWKMINKFCAVAALITTLVGWALNTAVAQTTQHTGIKNVVLVHGAFADGSGWEAVAKILEKDGYTVLVAQPPETSYADDVKYTKASIDAMGGPVVLVGHSYGRSIISEAGDDPSVAALVPPHIVN
jgi:pimeloyl-ACP methyl ester carboxylesterase